MYFHLRRGQPVVPSKPVYRIHKLNYEATKVLDLTDSTLLASLGLDMQNFGKLGYPGRSAEFRKSQVISEAANFLGCDGIVVPSARWNTSNVFVFCEQSAAYPVDNTDDGQMIDWPAWLDRIGST